MTLLADAVPLDLVRRALVIKLRHHGDVLLASPLIALLKQRATTIEVDALVYDDTVPMLEGHPGLAQLHVVGRDWRRLGTAARLRAELGLLRRLGARRFDLVLHLSESWRGAWLVRTLRPRWSVAPARAGAHRFWSRSFTHLVRQARGRHTVETNLDALRRIGVHPQAHERALVLEPGDAARARVAELLTRHGLAAQRFVHIHAPSRWHFKCWTTAGWVEVASRLQAAGWPVVLTAAPDEAEIRMTAAVQQRLASPAVDLSGQLQLRELAALAGEARLFVGVDSAPMHIAAAMRTPTVALFGPSGADLWGPWGEPRLGHHRVVTSLRHGCRPCGLDGCGGSKVSDCLAMLEAGRVWEAISAVLQDPVVGAETRP